MSHLTKATNNTMNKLNLLTKALDYLKVEHKVANNGEKFVAESNYAERENVKVDILLTQFVGNKNKSSIGFILGDKGFYTMQGDQWTVKDKNPQRKPEFKVIEANNSNFNMERFNNQVVRFYNMSLIEEAVSHKGMSLMEDSVQEFQDGRDVSLKFACQTFIDGEEVILNCVAKSNGDITYEVKGIKGSGCKDLTDFLDQQVQILSTVETEEMNMELDVENHNSEWH